MTLTPEDTLALARFVHHVKESIVRNAEIIDVEHREGRSFEQIAKEDGPQEHNDVGLFQQCEKWEAKLKEANNRARPGRKGLTGDDEMPFGKHKGERLDDVPEHYLRWLWEEADEPVCDNPGHPLHGYLEEVFS